MSAITISSALPLQWTRIVRLVTYRDVPTRDRNDDLIITPCAPYTCRHTVAYIDERGVRHDDRHADQLDGGRLFGLGDGHVYAWDDAGHARRVEFVDIEESAHA